MIHIITLKEKKKQCNWHSPVDENFFHERHCVYYSYCQCRRNHLSVRRLALLELNIRIRIFQSNMARNNIYDDNQEFSIIV
jgi:hypothetical protein